MPELISEKMVTARTATCQCCQQRIEPGTKYLRSTYVYDGRIYNWQTCSHCEEITAEVYDWCGEPDEGIGADCYHEWATENRDHPEWGTAATAYLERSGGVS